MIQSPIDRAITQFDRALRTLTSHTQVSGRPSPAASVSEQQMTESEKKHSIGLMRVNHTGEVCAQALYQGQAATAKLDKVRKDMQHAADEEIDHLAWCEDRLTQLNSRPSLLNPLWYALSFGMGAVAGLINDRTSLGFVAATEEQVARHLNNHLNTLPEQDEKSRAIVKTMLEDEQQHGEAALRAGGYQFPKVVKKVMWQAAKVMTRTSYRI